MAKGVGEIVRYEPAPEPMVGAVAIALLTLLNLMFVVLFVAAFVDPRTPVLGVFAAGKTPVAQQFQGFMLANALTTTAFILAIYRRWYLPDVLIVKKRRNKFEDL